MTLDDLRQEVLGRKVLFVTTKNLDYIRIQQELRFLKQHAGELEICASRSSIYLWRCLVVLLKCLTLPLSRYDVVFFGFLPQLVLPFVWLPRPKPLVVSDLFISLFDTLVYDRQLFGPDSIPGRLAARLDRSTLGRSHIVITDTAAHGAYWTELFGPPPGRNLVWYLEADPGLFDSHRFPLRTSPNTPFEVLYFGSILPLQGIDVLLEALVVLQRNLDLHFTVVGPIGRDRLLAYSDLGNTTFVPWLDQNSLSSAIHRADLCLAGHFAAEIRKARSVIPGKAFLYQSLGRPMILGENPANRERFPYETELVSYVRMGDPVSLAEGILTSWSKGNLAMVDSSKCLVTIIVPVFNTEAYLDACLASLAAQTHREIEVLVVDDGSTDHSLKIAQEWERRDPRFRVTTQPNRGVSSARNVGLSRARGDFIGFVDGDDWVEPGYVAGLVGPFRDPSVDLTVCGYRRELRNRKTEDHRFRNSETIDRNTAAILMLTAPEFGGYLWNKLFRTELVQATSLRFDESFPMSQDFLWVAEYLNKTKVTVTVPRVLYQFVHNPGSTTRVLGSRKAYHESKCRATLEMPSRLERFLDLNVPSVRQALSYRTVRSNLWVMRAAAVARHFDSELFHLICHTVRSGLAAFTKSPRSSAEEKAAAVLIAVSPHLFFHIYPIVGKET